MRWTSVLAIYLLLLIASAFVLLPFGVRTDEEAGNQLVPGQATSAPSRFNFGRHMVRAAILAAVLVALFDLNYVYGWVTADDVDFYRDIFG